MANVALKVLTPIIEGMANKVYVTVCNQITDKFKIIVDPKFTELGTKMDALEIRLDEMLKKINPEDNKGGEVTNLMDNLTSTDVVMGGKKIIKTRKYNNNRKYKPYKYNNRKSKKHKST